MNNDSNRVRNLDEIDKLDTLMNYFKYVYEIEIARMERMKSSSKAYSAFIASTFGFIVAAIELSHIDFAQVLAARNQNDFRFVQIVLFIISAILLVVSFVFVVISDRIRQYERLCEPTSLALSSEVMSSEQLKKEIIANYAVAATRNSEINQRRAKWLSLALSIYFVCILVLFVLGGISVLRSG